MSTIIWTATLLVAGAWLAASAAAATAVEVKAYEVRKKFEGNRAADLSGIACVPLGDDEYRCLVIDDENQFAELAKVENGTIEAKDEIELIEKKNDPKRLGKKPSPDCRPDDDDFAEFDGEGVAYSRPYFYVVGSHGCSRKNDTHRISSFILARIRVNEKGQPVDANDKVLDEDEMEKAVETTYRVSDLLERADTVGQFFGKSLKTENGLNIEGIAVDGDRVFLGLRAPVNGTAYIVEGSAEALFAPGDERLPEDEKPALIRVPLGDKVGIRDMALLPDDKLLILAGATQEPDIPYSIFLLDLKDKDLSELVPQRPCQQKRAEAMAVLETTPQKIRVLMLFDGSLDGAPQEVIIPLQAR